MASQFGLGLHWSNKMASGTDASETEPMQVQPVETSQNAKSLLLPPQVAQSIQHAQTTDILQEAANLSGICPPQSLESAPQHGYQYQYTNIERNTPNRRSRTSSTPNIMMPPLVNGQQTFSQFSGQFIRCPQQLAMTRFPAPYPQYQQIQKGPIKLTVHRPIPPQWSHKDDHRPKTSNMNQSIIEMGLTPSKEANIDNAKTNDLNAARNSVPSSKNMCQNKETVPVVKSKNQVQNEITSASTNKTVNVNKPSFSDVAARNTSTPKDKGSAKRKGSTSNISPQENNNKKNRTQSRHPGEVPPLVIEGDLDEYQHPRFYGQELKTHIPDRLIEKAKLIRNGSLLLFAKTTDARKLILQNYPSKTIFRGKTTIRESRYRDSPNYTVVARGVYLDMPVEEFSDIVKSAGYEANVQRLKNKNGEETTSVKITMKNQIEQQKIISEGLKHDYTHYEVNEFRNPLPRPQQCYRCQGYDHIQTSCPSSVQCLVCAKQHSHKICDVKDQNEYKCANCLGNHTAVSANCPMRIEAINKLNAHGRNEVMGAQYITPRTTRNTRTPRSRLPPPNQNVPQITRHPLRNLKNDIEDDPAILIAIIAVCQSVDLRTDLGDERKLFNSLCEATRPFGLNLNKTKVLTAIKTLQKYTQNE